MPLDSIYSHEYEFYSLFEATTTKKDVDEVHTYETQLDIGHKSSVRPNKLDSTYVNIYNTGSVRIPRDSNASMDVVTLGLKLLMNTFYELTMNALEPVKYLPLIHPKLIECNFDITSIKVPMFSNEYSLAYYLNVVKLVTSSTSKSSVNMTKKNMKYLSLKIKKKKNRHYDGKNHL